MSAFTMSNGKSVDPSLNNEILTSVLVREPDRLDELPNNYTVIDKNMLNFNNSTSNGYVDSDGYFHANGAGDGGQAIALLEDDGTISISFRGTNDAADLSSITSFNNNNYIYAFEDWLESVADFASKYGYKIDLVTGKSLGGAATNMLHEEANEIAGGAYENATFFAVASPLISSKGGNIINFGYENDYAFEWYEERFGSGGGDYNSSMDNMVFYNSEYASKPWISWLDFSAHSYNAFENGFDAISKSRFYNQMNQDDLIIITDTKNINVDLAMGRTQSNADETYVLAGKNANFKIAGSDKTDNIEMAGGNDKIYGNGGNDVIFGGGGKDTIGGGDGNDKLHGGDGKDNINGGNGDDVIFGNNDSDNLNGSEGHDVLYGDTGQDTLAGGSGNDELYGGNWNDKLYGGKGNDVLYGDLGDDALYGGKGNDIFKFSINDDEGFDEINDFEIGRDKIEIYSPKTSILENTIDGTSPVIYPIEEISVTDCGDGTMPPKTLPENLLGEKVTVDVQKSNIVSMDDTKNGLTIELNSGTKIIFSGRNIEDFQDYADDHDIDHWEDVLFL